MLFIKWFTGGFLIALVMSVLIGVFSALLRVGVEGEIFYNFALAVMTVIFVINFWKKNKLSAIGFLGGVLFFIWFSTHLSPSPSGHKSRASDDIGITVENGRKTNL